MGSEAKKDDDLKKRLSDEQYRVTQEKATERPFTGRWLEPTGLRYCINSASLDFEKTS